MEPKPNRYLFEVSWEVCNKVGGIYTVLQSKARTAADTFGENYYVLGPDLKTNAEFEETDEECWQRVREATAIKEIPCRFGRWRIPGNPKAILIDFGRKYNKEQLLYQLWEDYGIDSIAGQWDYIEPVMFGHACGEVIETIYNVVVAPHGGEAIAHVHEWMCGAALLQVKKSTPEIATVFTTHATMLGRALAGSGVDIYGDIEHISPQKEATAFNVVAKCSMECATARESDCFTTVSAITATEARSFLGRTPDVIVPNGLDLGSIPDLSVDRAPALAARQRLLDFAARFLDKTFPPHTTIMVISGRYEFHNKGIDVFLQALQRLEADTTPDRPVLAFCLVMAGHKEVIPSSIVDPAHPGGMHRLATHRLDHEAGDPITNSCRELGLRNAPDSRVGVIFVPAFLNGYDGALNMDYYTAISGADIGVFPSYYEPWGYTPLESAAFAVPTVTTDQAGFGLWARETTDGQNGGVILLDRQKKDMPTIAGELHQILRGVIGWSDAELAQRRASARRVAEHAQWKDFYGHYRRAYDVALEQAARRRSQGIAGPKEELKHAFVGTGSSQPHFRIVTAEVNLPQNLIRLRELAYNLWWAWNPRALSLFSHLDPHLWDSMENNPVRMLESVSPARLQEMARDEGYTALYAQILQQFDEYMHDKSQSAAAEPRGRIKWSSPVAYFSTEYGIHECLPVYSGGLGVLSGDHLKSSSDLNLPLIGAGLLYRQGYFRQRIDRAGWQIAEYPDSDFSNMPVQVVRDDRGNDVQITLDLPGRTLHASIWEVQVGRVPLYLLDTDTVRNTPQDRHITSRLYCADRRTRIEQEILLGMGGVRMLRKLGIRPSVYHMNEGHSAFLILELIREMMADEGLSFDEAKEAVRARVAFTTHTPVEAGHERFAKDIIEYYFASYVQRVGISWSQFWELGRREAGEDKPFYMTMMGLKLSHARNAVSRMHEFVSRRMWQDAWKGFHYSDVPITHVTNGIHAPSFIDPRMADLLNTYLGLDWPRRISSTDRWKRVRDIPSAAFWQTRVELKQKLAVFLRENITRCWAKYSASCSYREELLSLINPSALWIGFARRFAPYKRADLILSDLERLERIVSDDDMPVQILFAGKAHPEDRMGIELLKKVVDVCNEPRFKGRIFFIEDYDLRAARAMVRGVDVWLNTPRRPLEASGTSGQKAAVNGVLNLSISDGWWCEGYDGTNGWTIGPVATTPAPDDEDSLETDSKSLYSLIEDTIVRLYFNRDASGIPQEWVAMSKRAVETLAPRFSSERMLKEYLSELYIPTAERAALVAADRFKLARETSDWKRRIPMRFSSLRILDVRLKGTRGDSIVVGKPFSVVVRVDPGQLEPDEVLAELIIGRTDGRDFIGYPQSVPLRPVPDTKGTLTLTADYVVQENGPHAYGIRVMPCNRNLACKQEAELVIWG